MAPPALSHHRILEIVAPFSRGGWRVDLAASDRDVARLRFKTRPVAGTPEGADAVRESLVLQATSATWWQLARTIDRGDGAPALVESAGADPAALLDAVMRVTPSRAFGNAHDGLTVARQFWIAPSPGAEAELVAGTVRGPGLELELTVPATRGVSAAVTLSASAGAATAWPSDLLAVLGWSWAPLDRAPGGWKSRVRLRGRGAARAADAERRLDEVAAHLARTLAEPPAAFHDRHLRARWGVVLRRAMPLATAVALFVGVALLPRLGLESLDGAWMLMYHVPTLLLAGVFMLQEMPRFEIPPLPRRPRDGAWVSARDHAR